MGSVTTFLIKEYLKQSEKCNKEITDISTDVSSELELPSKAAALIQGMKRDCAAMGGSEYLFICYKGAGTLA